MDPIYFHQLIHDSRYRVNSVASLEKIDLASALPSPGAGSILPVIRTAAESGVYRVDVQATDLNHPFPTHTVTFEVGLVEKDPSFEPRLESSVASFMEDQWGYPVLTAFTKMIYAEKSLTDDQRLRAGTTAALAMQLKEAVDRNETLFLIRTGLMALSEEWICFRGNKGIVKRFAVEFRNQLKGKSYVWRKEAGNPSWDLVFKSFKMPILPYYLLSLVMHLDVKLDEEQNQILEVISRALYHLASYRFTEMLALLGTAMEDIVAYTLNNKDGSSLFLQLMDYEQATGDHKNESVNFEDIVKEASAALIISEQQQEGRGGGGGGGRRRGINLVDEMRSRKPFSEILSRMMLELKQPGERISSATQQMQQKMQQLPRLLREQGLGGGGEEEEEEVDTDTLATNLSLAGIKLQLSINLKRPTNEMQDFFLVTVPPSAVFTLPDNYLLNQRALRIADMPAGILSVDEKGTIRTLSSLNPQQIIQNFTELLLAINAKEDSFQNEDNWSRIVSDFLNNPGISSDEIRNKISGGIRDEKGNELIKPISFDDDDVELLKGNNIKGYSEKLFSKDFSKEGDEFGEKKSIPEIVEALFSVLTKFNFIESRDSGTSSFLGFIDAASELFSKRLKSKMDASRLLQQEKHDIESAISVTKNIVVPAKETLDKQTLSNRLKELLSDLLHSEHVKVWQESKAEGMQPVVLSEQLTSANLSEKAMTSIVGAITIIGQSTGDAIDTLKNLLEAKKKEELIPGHDFDYLFESNHKRYPIETINLLENSPGLVHANGAFKEVTAIYLNHVSTKDDVNEIKKGMIEVNATIKIKEKFLKLLVDNNLVNTALDAEGNFVHKIKQYAKEKSDDKNTRIITRMEDALNNPVCSGDCPMKTVANLAVAVSGIETKIANAKLATEEILKTQNYKDFEKGYNLRLKQQQEEEEDSAAAEGILGSQPLSDLLVGAPLHLNNNNGFLKKDSLEGTKFSSPQDAVKSSEIINLLKRRCQLQFPVPLLMNSVTYEIINSVCDLSSESFDCISISEIVKAVALDQIWKRIYSSNGKGGGGGKWIDNKKGFISAWPVFGLNKTSSSSSADANTKLKQMENIISVPFENYFSPSGGIIELPLLMQALFNSDMIAFNSIEHTRDRISWLSQPFKKVFTITDDRMFVQHLFASRNRIAVFRNNHPAYPWGCYCKISSVTNAATATTASGKNKWLSMNFDDNRIISEEEVINEATEQFRLDQLELVVDVGAGGSINFSPQEGDADNKFIEREQILKTLVKNSLESLELFLNNISSTDLTMEQKLESILDGNI